MKRLDRFFVPVPHKKQVVDSTNEKPLSFGKVRVAKYYPGKPLPVTEGFTNVLIHTKGGPLGGDLSPYVLKDENGQLLENIWQFSKVYPSVQRQNQAVSRWMPDKINWVYPDEVHVQNNEVLPAYWNWRKLGMKNQYAVRYPNGFHGRRQCVFSLWPSADDPNTYERLDYIQARKRIYCGEYARLAPLTPHFKKLSDMLKRGENIQIVEVDGPDPSLSYPPYDQISSSNPGLLITEETIRLLINDRNKPFGHGFVIAALLLGGQDWMK